MKNNPLGLGVAKDRVSEKETKHESDRPTGTGWCVVAL